MLYTYFCPSCDKERDEDHKMSESPVITCECGTVMHKKVTGGMGFVLKEGEFGWTGKDIKNKRDKMTHAEKMSEKQRSTYGDSMFKKG